MSEPTPHRSIPPTWPARLLDLIQPYTLATAGVLVLLAGHVLGSLLAGAA